jgi:hypothetical protein
MPRFAATRNERGAEAVVIMSVLRTWILGLLVLFIWAWGRPASCSEAGPICSFQFENDFFGGGTDRHFTHGSRVSYQTKPIPWITKAAGRLPGFLAEGLDEDSAAPLKARANISLGQNIYTPEDITAHGLLEEERPYAGWLYAGFGLVINRGDKRYDQVEMDIGVIGPSSLAEKAQKAWHDIFGLQRPNGWDHQLENELGFVLFYEQARRFYTRESLWGLRLDVIPHFGGSLGNVFTYGAAGFAVRLGPHLQRDFGPPRIRPSLPGAGFFRKGGFSWYVFVGVEGRLVLHNVFLDGNTFSSSHSVDRKPFTGDVQAGIAIQKGRVRVTYTQIYRGKEYDGQESADQFGAFSLSYQF